MLELYTGSLCIAVPSHQAIPHVSRDRDDDLIIATAVHDEQTCFARATTISSIRRWFDIAPAMESMFSRTSNCWPD
jgi:hypothetical protein